MNYGNDKCIASKPAILNDSLENSITLFDAIDASKSLIAGNRASMKTEQAEKQTSIPHFVRYVSCTLLFLMELTLELGPRSLQTVATLKTKIKRLEEIVIQKLVVNMNHFQIIDLEILQDINFSHRHILINHMLQNQIK